MFTALVYQTYQWVRALGGVSIALAPIRSLVILIGAAFAGWTIGNLLIDKLKTVQKLVDSISNVVAGPLADSDNTNFGDPALPAKEKARVS